MHANASKAEETTAQVSEASPLVERACDACRQSYRPTKKWQRFCSPVCRNRFNHEKSTVPALLQRMKALEERVAYLEQLAMPVR